MREDGGTYMTGRLSSLTTRLRALLPPARQSIGHVLDHEAVAWVVLVLALLFTTGLWQYSEMGFVERENERFLHDAEKQKSALISRMGDHEQVLRGSAALFATDEMPSREQWRAYVEAIEPERSLPGTLGMGFTLMVPQAAKAEHEKTVRSQGFPEYAINPPGDRPLLSSIIYLEPFAGDNMRAFGYDMYSNPKRREAMEKARDTGRPALSRKVTLVQEGGITRQPGFLMYFPVYRNGMPRDTTAARREALIGFVYSAFRSHDLVQEVFKDPNTDVEIQLFDGKPAPENLLFSSKGSARQARHVVDKKLEIGGHVWVARISSSQRFENNARSSQPLMILFGGLTLDILLFSLLYTHATHRQVMREGRVKLEQVLASYRTLVAKIPGAAFRAQVGAPLPVEQLSQGIKALTGEPPERFLSGEILYNELIHPDDRLKVSEAVADAIAKMDAYEIEYRIRSTDGFTRWVSERGRVRPDWSGQTLWVDGLILDITERKAAEIMIRDLAFNDPLTGLPNRRLLLDRLDQQLAISGRTGRYGAVLFIDMDNFKVINDTLGHDAGDQVLVEVAGRLSASVRESDTVGRLGGDEFVVILDNLGDTVGAAEKAATELSNKILSQLSEPYRLGEHTCSSTPSIGITIFLGHGVRADQLLRQADQAMYKAKSAGRGQLQFYEGIAA